MGLLVVATILSWLLVGVGCWLALQLLRQGGRVLLRLDDLEQRLARAESARTPRPWVPSTLPIGTPAPVFELPDLNGEPRSLTQLGGYRVLLVFFNPGCGFCVQMAPELAALPADGRDGHPIPLVVSGGEEAATRQLVTEYCLRCPVLLDAHGNVASLYQAAGTPMGYLIDAQGRISSDLVMGAEALLALVSPTSRNTNGSAAIARPRNGQMALGGRRAVSESKIPRQGLAAGTSAPPFRVPRLDGGELNLDAYRGRRVLLVFSDPNCGPCDQMAPQLERYHRTARAVQVVMISRGDVAANQAKAAEHSLTFPIGLQRQWEVSRQYGIFATPVGYLIDETGLIALDVAVGGEAILALLASVERENRLPASV